MHRREFTYHTQHVPSDEEGIGPAPATTIRERFLRGGVGAVGVLSRAVVAFNLRVKRQCARLLVMHILIPTLAAI